MTTVQDLAAMWAATADSTELAQVEQLCRTYVRSHGQGILTTEECRAVYSAFVQDGNEKGNGKMYAYAVAVAAAVSEAPYGSLSAWEHKRTRIATKATERKERNAAAREARKLDPTTPGKATSHSACSHAATPAGRRACRSARKAQAAQAA